MHPDAFNVAELQVIVAALFYELRDDPVLTDATFDILAKSVEHSMINKVPGYTACTGQWALDIINDHGTEWNITLAVCDALMGNCRVLHHPIIEKALNRPSD